MYCPQCGTESASSLQYCRLCGANLKVIGKAVTLSEAIARSDRGPLPKLKEMVKNFKIEQVKIQLSRSPAIGIPFIHPSDRLLTAKRAQAWCDGPGWWPDSVGP